MLVSVRRAKEILLVVGTCLALFGVMALPYARTSPKAQSLFERAAMTGAFTRPGVVLISIGLVCLGVAALLPKDRE